MYVGLRAHGEWLVCKVAEFAASNSAKETNADESIVTNFEGECS